MMASSVVASAGGRAAAAAATSAAVAVTATATPPAAAFSASMLAGSSGSSLMSKISSIPSTYPFSFGFVLSGIKTSLSDLLVQKVVERREEIDWKRNAAFATFGFFYLGGVQYLIYVPLFGRLFPGAASFAAKPIREKVRDFRGMLNVCAQVFLDQCVHHPLMYFPVFYCTKEIVTNHDGPDFKKCLGEYKGNMKEDLLALWKVWVPSTFINFTFMPMWGRIPFVAATSALWTCILSAMRGGDVMHGDDMAGGAVTSATFTMMEEGIGALFASTPELEPQLSHYAITAAGHDKTGQLAQLARAISNAGGNITYSKMVRLGSDCIMLMHVAVPPTEQRSMVNALTKSKELKSLNVQCKSLKRRKTGTYEKPVTGLHLRCVGADKKGMLALVAEKLSERGFAVEKATTNLVNLYNRREFVIEVDCTITEYMDHDHIHAVVTELGTLKADLDLDILDIRVQRLVEDQQ